MTPASFPAILGTDFAGVVEAVGENVSKFRAGDEVFGFVGGFKGPDGDVPGSLAEYTVADARLIAHKPKMLDFRQAAGLAMVGVTAWLALHHKVSINKSTRVLIQGGTGGVGHVAVQLAKAAGAQVFATVANEESAVLARKFGAEVALVSSAITPAEIVAKYTDGVGFDVIFDTVGGPALDAAFTMIRPTGDVVTIVGAATHSLAPLYLRGANLHTVLVLVPIMFGCDSERQGLILDQLRQLADQGALVPMLDPKTYTLATAADAHRAIEAGQAAGKLIIDIGKA
jgi:NADPH2:quinone reductase